MADAGALLVQARGHEAAGRLADAWAIYQESVRLAPNDLSGIAALLGFLTKIGKLDGILPLYRQAIALGWRDPAAAVALGNVLVSRYQFAEAEEVFRGVLAGAPGDQGALRGLGFALGGLKRFAEAIECLERTSEPAAGQVLLKAHVWAQAHLAAARAGRALEEGHWQDATRLLGQSIDIERGLLPQTTPALELSGDSSLRRIHRLLYIEVELKAREFEARVLLALHAAAQGLDVVIGQKMVISKIGFAKLPAGIVLIKTMNGMDVGRVKGAAEAGHMVVVIDEEAFGGSGRRPLWMRLNTDPEALARTDLIIAQGQEYADLLAAVFPEAAAKTRVLGNPRVDLCRPEFRKAQLNPGAAPGILICSQSQVCNPRGITFPDLISLHVRGVPMGEEIGGAVIAGTKEVFAYEISMIPQLQAATRMLAHTFPDTPILFRPHPAEDPVLWEQAFSRLANVTVSSAGALTDALRDAKALVYVRGCATGLEAHFQGVPIIRFDGDGRAPEPGDWISSNIGFPAQSPDDVVEALQKIAAGETTDEADKAEVARSFHSEGGRPVSAGVAAGLAEAAARRALPDPAALAKLRALAGGKTTQRDFDAHKFPATSLEEVRELAARLATVAGLPLPGIEAFAYNVFIFQGSGS